MAKTRSPNYPAISLPEALELVTKLYAREKRSPADPQRVALALGYRSLSGPARTKLSALRKFDLVEETGNGVRVSELALTILFPASPEEKANALRTAATFPGLFRELAGYPGASDDNLVSRLVRTGFTEAGAKVAVASFRKTMSLAPDEDSTYHVPDESDPNVLAPVPGAGRQQLPTGANRGSLIEIKLPDGAKAELRLPDRLTTDALEAVVGWLKAAPVVDEEPAGAGASPAPERDSTEQQRPASQSLIVSQD